ncbi:hypothetical protein TEA_025782 [Camellia sinensis var. sinensis]|uniref:Thioredoxin domain-containing protein n=1 Tax=Camellia sinensis var. sinensis TaxID=542762 RepID=A0A4V3WQ88_CAMSN|nr:hypothetical protein TEA_025782 [Camellia sinensis var. sinensis]
MENVGLREPHILNSVMKVDYGECFRVYNNPNITVHFNTETLDIVSNTKGQMSGILVRKVDTGEESVLEAKGLFYGIGHSPNSQFLEGQIELDSSGYVLVEEGTAKTSVEGVFAAGDVQDHEWRQAITAAGSGCIAALSVERYLTSNNLLVEFHQPKTEEVKKDLTDRDVHEGFDITLTKHKGQYALRKLYHESPRLICVLYTAPTCGPCRTLKPILSKVIDEYDQNVHFVEIDIEEDPEIAEAAGIMGTPCVQFFKNKEMLRTVSGVKMKKEYKEFIEANKRQPSKAALTSGSLASDSCALRVAPRQVFSQGRRNRSSRRGGALLSLYLKGGAAMSLSWGQCLNKPYLR